MMKSYFYLSLLVLIGLVSCQKEQYQPNESQLLVVDNHSPYAKLNVTVTRQEDCSTGDCASSGYTQSAVVNATVTLTRITNDDGNDSNVIQSKTTDQQGLAVFEALEEEQVTVTATGNFGKITRKVNTPTGKTTYINLVID